MKIRVPRWRSAMSSWLVAAAMGCGDVPAAPRAIGTIRVSITTLGGDLDLNGYDVVVDRLQHFFLTSTMSVQITDVSEGVHTIVLENVAPNCGVTGSNTRTVKVSGLEVVSVDFEVNCVATAIVVTTRTVGTTNPPTYQLVLNGAPSILLDANGTATMGRLKSGAHRLALAISAEHCRVVGVPEIVIFLNEYQTVQTGFEVDCGSPIRREKIAFVFDTLYSAGLHWIALVSPDGSEPRKLGPGTGPAWSPDGTQLAYSNADCESFFYYRWPCTGGVVLFDPETSRTTKRPETSGGFEPAWAPSGDAIAFSHCCTTVMKPDQLWATSLAAPAVGQIPTGALSVVDNPAWSPDGLRIAFECADILTRNNVCVVNRDGTGLERLTDGLVPYGDPAWSPDGTRLTFTRDASIVVMRLDDRTVTTLATGSDPAWSPDGTRLVFAGTNGLYIIDADGSNLKRLTTGQHHAPTWRP